MIQGPEADANVQPALGHVFARVIPLGFFAALLPLAATVQQLPAFEDGLTFWRAQRAREEASDAPPKPHPPSTRIQLETHC